MKEQLWTLKEAVQTCENPQAAFDEGLKILDLNQENYDSKKPNLKQVQLIWWEFEEKLERDLGRKYNELSKVARGQAVPTCTNG